jgi:hypothetical protein
MTGVDAVAQQVIEWWLDVESLDWDRETAVVRVPVAPPQTTVRLGVGSSKAPETFGHELVIRQVVDLDARHDGGYPFAQPVERLAFDTDRGELTIELGFGSKLAARVEAPDLEVVSRSESG